MNSYCTINGDKPLSLLSSITTSKPLEAAFTICSLYFNLASIMMLRILTWSLGLIVCPLMVKGSHLDLYDLVAKYMITIFSTSKVILLLFS
jgi:hypothetical protein